ncbi:sialate O-acetylesterase [Aquimarina sp. U1-2]|uniref:sialate O-acetylesterase n=1 Tax=Aquimarina sp. U1-2 TaxID=2823141 RepID=UPI001AED0E23|nr:sialate O-acetylesterase [Aquimarina sp. U1-2]MBP2830681.1 sialate O-acetylesterase [Aquimarina sp. U1-2]
MKIKLRYNFLKGVISVITLLYVVHSMNAQVTIPHKGQPNLPKETAIVSVLPKKKHLWIFIMAGQSNMAGRAFISPQDTIPNAKILTVTQQHEWAYAKAPLHRYKPKLMGLDCGRSFAEEILEATSDSIHIALLPCAVGGTSIKEWLGDSLRKNVRLYTNLKEQVTFAKQYGTIKGMLWHQGESDANTGLLTSYKDHLLETVQRIRTEVNNPALPIIIGELGKNNRNVNNQMNREVINKILLEVSNDDEYMRLVSSKGFTTFDGYHFDNTSVKLMGKRYAQAFMNLSNGE